ncbi:alpha-ketoacid dehydrogenase kinase [Gloeophyllum trabeum ATCC 11539]|uniref:Protein-serine/threonine kinase n=1 Tax=Gloeophyllum trabeum (strain ATCC 11539 / FP-39264 / Madison 617) TaxID=670483 RepID=S7RWJ3_GLOTA|nr:alpha-ketoacid dehydrogenase kinase [Gloeophyllum trabeum ATCC 11539]EPQ59265.1 alpha-ketoacid dehydrogenase kinase [Gloeophyllum trabeum ATCC 11539]
MKRLLRRAPVTHGVNTERRQSTALHFYQNRQLELYASKQTKRLTLRQLVFFGRSMNEERLIQSGNYVRTELPVRIAHRIRDLQALPYVVVTQEGVARVYELYWSAFEKFRRYPEIKTLSDNEAFCAFLRDILEEHAAVIPSLSLGLSLSSPYLPPDQLDSFMRRMLVSRISRRVLAEHHIALSEHFARRDSRSGDVGIIDTGLNISESVNKCVKFLRDRRFDLEEDGVDMPDQDKEWPEVVVEGHLNAKFSYIREHLEYIVFELLKNSMRATGLKHLDKSTLPPIHATIAASTDEIGIRISDQGMSSTSGRVIKASPQDLFSFSHTRNAARLETSRIGALRTVSSSKQGMKATVDEQLQWWKRRRRDSAPSFDVDARSDDIETEAGVAPHPRIGIGLPMSNIFARYFGGSLELISLDGWGTDAYIRLPKLGTNLEGIEL